MLTQFLFVFYKMFVIDLKFPEKSSQIYTHIKKDTPAIKEILLKWGHFLRAKYILKMLPVFSNMYLRSFRSFQRGTASFCRLNRFRVVSCQSQRSGKYSAVQPIVHYLCASQFQYLYNRIILKTLQPCDLQRLLVFTSSERAKTQ